MESSKKYKRQYISDALEDFRKVLHKMDCAYDDLCEWFNCYGSSGIRGSFFMCQHDDEADKVGFTGNDIYDVISKVVTQIYGSNTREVFSPKCSFDDLQSNEDQLDECIVEILSELDNKYVDNEEINKVEVNERFLNLDLD